MYILVPGLKTQVDSAGFSVQVADISMGTKGGIIINPLTPADQTLSIAESLFVNLLDTASANVSKPGTVELLPGQWFLVPPNSNVWVNAASGHHKFTAIFTELFEPQFPPIVVPGQPGSGLPAYAAEPGAIPFPPPGVTGLTTVIPSYLYQEYSDDDDLQGWCEAQNIAQQDFVDTFNALNLPIYPGPIVSGALLDWVARGVYGMARPALRTGRAQQIGPLNTYGSNWLIPMWMVVGAHESANFALNVVEQVGPGNVVVATDDIYRRILTWHFYKADGNYFCTRWLKRRVWRFCYCKDGWSTDFAVDPMTGAEHKSRIGPFALLDDAFIADTKQISVTLGANRNITIRFVLGKRTVTGGALMNRFGCNGFEPEFGTADAWDIGDRAIYLNDLETTYEVYPPLPLMYTFKEAIDCGALEVPYQFNFTCNIG